MALYDNVPDITKAPKGKKKVVSKRQRSQMPGHPASDSRDLSESGDKKSAKPAKATGKAVSNPFDTKNKGDKVAGNGGGRDSVAQGARKASTRSPKPNSTDKKVRGQVKK